MSAYVIRHLVIRGRVQGVGYRAFVEDEARQRHLEGWVRNRRDGSVEAIFAGRQQAVDAVIEACRRGPMLARVERLEITDAGVDALAARRPGEWFSLLPSA